MSHLTLTNLSKGMVPYKDLYLNPPLNAPNLVSAQKCLRAGGKHNDLDNVGFTPRHHTFFEMLGNFSFGGYFKEEAIHLAYTYLKEDLQLDTDKLLVSVYEDDLETEKLWKQLTGKSPVLMGAKDNWWSMGDEKGLPCGPCSEIYYGPGP